jgi:hypothetical protein
LKKLQEKNWEGNERKILESIKLKLNSFHFGADEKIPSPIATAYRNTDANVSIENISSQYFFVEMKY